MLCISCHTRMFVGEYKRWSVAGKTFAPKGLQIAKFGERFFTFDWHCIVFLLLFSNGFYAYMCSGCIFGFTVIFIFVIQPLNSLEQKTKIWEYVCYLWEYICVEFGKHVGRPGRGIWKIMKIDATKKVRKWKLCEKYFLVKENGIENLKVSKFWKG